MVIKYTTKGGSRIHGPPYTKKEEADFYTRVGRGPIVVATSSRKQQQSPSPRQPSPVKPRRS